MRIISVSVEFGTGQEKALEVFQIEVPDVETYTFSFETKKENYKFLIDSTPFMIVVDENKTIIYEGNPAFINLSKLITSLLQKENKKDLKDQEIKKMKQFFSDPEFLQLINSQINHKKLFNFKFQFEQSFDFDAKLMKICQIMKKPKLYIEYHVAHAEFAKMIFKKIFATFPQEFFDFSEKSIQPKEKKQYCLSFIRNQITPLIPMIPQSSFQMIIAQNFNANIGGAIKEPKVLLFLGEWPKNDEFLLFKANVNNFRYYNEQGRILKKFDFLFFNNSLKDKIRGLLSEKKTISETQFNKLITLIRSEKWIQSWKDAYKENKYDFGASIELFKVIILNNKLDEKEVVFTQPFLEYYGDEEEIPKIQNHIKKIVYSVLEEKMFANIEQRIERRVIYYSFFKK